MRSLRKRDFAIAASLLCFSVVAAAYVEVPIGDAEKVLSAKLGPGVRWDAKHALRADVMCTGHPAIVMVGHGRDSILIAVVPDTVAKPTVFEFPTNHPEGQDAFCGTKVALALESRNCFGAGDVPIPGCRIIKGCSAFGAYDDECDAFHFYWDNRLKKITYTRL